MEMNSPAAMEKAPARSPATPARRMTLALVPAPATPITRQVLETRPSLTPNTPARSVPHRSYGGGRHLPRRSAWDGLRLWLPPGPPSPCRCLLYTSDAADDLLCVDLGGR